MTARWLLAAEADQIQDLIFRSAKLREVVGGSQLLARFCREAPDAIAAALTGGGLSGPDRLVSDGGAFRLLLDDRESALNVAELLAEAYRRCVGGHLSVAPPVPCPADGFQQASEQAQQALATAKRRRAGAAASRHLPHAAFCETCGVGLAEQYGVRRPWIRDQAAVPRESDKRESLEELGNPSDPGAYRCADCAAKFAEPFRSGKTGLMGRFRRAVHDHISDELVVLREPDQRDWPEEFGSLHPKRYVAYLAADGNAMGQAFGRCARPEQLQRLSADLTDALRDALAEQCARLINTEPVAKTLARSAPNRHSRRSMVMPLLPLILGGDDLFALLPAPWAIDCARRLVASYERAMSEAIERLDLGADLPRPTLSVAVVFCKANYPHRFAHQRCEHELKQAKRAAHLQPATEAASVLSYGVITGNEVGGGQESASGHYRPTLAPFILRPSAMEDDLSRTVMARRTLDVLPQKRRVELAYLFDDPPTDEPSLATWNQRLAALRARIARDHGHGRALTQTLRALGAHEGQEDAWRSVPRYGDGEAQGMGHGLPDVLRLWEFLKEIPEADGGTR